jgi:hypothetical protein
MPENPEHQSMKVRKCLIFFNLHTMAKKKVYKVPNKAWAEWASSKTGKPAGEYWMQGIFCLTEFEGLSLEEAQKVMEEQWDIQSTSSKCRDTTDDSEPKEEDNYFLCPQHRPPKNRD